MNITLAPAELAIITEQLLAAMVPAFKKQVETAAKGNNPSLSCLTVEDAAKRLKCVSRTVLKYIEVGKIRAANFGTLDRPVYRISEADLVAYYVANSNR